MRKSNFYLTLIIIGGIAFGLYYFGIIQEINISEQEAGPFKVVYKTYIGSYSKAMDIGDELVDLLRDDGINASKKFILFYDDEEEVSKEQLRSEVGIILNEKDYDKIMNLKGKYNVKDIPRSKNAVAYFPYRGSLSIFLGKWRVYPKLNEYIESKGYMKSPLMEIYDSKNNKITYLIEI